MKPTVKLIEGRHITAHDKRNILDCIDYLATLPPCPEPPWLGRGQSPKRYAIEADPITPSRYTVRIRESYRSDYGQKREQIARVVVEIKGRDTQTPEPDLFS